ncbi:TraB/GumN family protein [Sulfitobacter sp. JB4-11]|uniref:TraB/GumN family protein n=1 Tax=Sulfitobacter rhodophyticola TaxID=3238304 RepID=UPI003516E7D0
MRLLLTALFLLLPAALSAACSGTDLRTTLSDAQKAEIAQRLEGVPFSNGIYWTATRGTRTVHVIGTLHMDDPRFDPITDALTPVINNADHLLVEADAESQAALQKAIAERPEMLFLTGETLIDLMPQQDWIRLAEAARVRGIPPFMAAKFQPWYLSLMLSMSPCTLQSMTANKNGLDMRIMALADAAGVPTGSLEPYETIFSLFNQDPMEEQIELLKLGIIPVTASENASHTLIEQYFDEEVIAALETSRVTTRAHFDMSPAEFDALFDEFMDLINAQRNLSWIDPIEATDGDSIVVAAGALHLGGEQGILNLLAQRGYTLERQSF